MIDHEQFVRIGNWLIATAAIDALGVDKDEHVLILRSGHKIFLDEAEAKDAWDLLYKDKGWRES